MMTLFSAPSSTVRRALRLVALAALAGLTPLADQQGRAADAPVDTTPVIPAGESQRLLEGDDIRIAFPGAPNLDTVQKIRSDGKISMPLIGEIRAAGLTPLELQKVLSEQYASQLNNPEVTVSVVASTFPVFVSGAVLNPGEVRCDRPTTVLEAIMKAGGFDMVRARTERVLVIRRGEKSREINMKAVLRGEAEDNYFLKPSDKIIVPEKTWAL